MGRQELRKLKDQRHVSCNCNLASEFKQH